MPERMDDSSLLPGLLQINPSLSLISSPWSLDVVQRLGWIRWTGKERWPLPRHALEPVHCDGVEMADNLLRGLGPNRGDGPNRLAVIEPLGLRLLCSKDLTLPCPS